MRVQDNVKSRKVSAQQGLDKSALQHNTASIHNMKTFSSPTFGTQTRGQMADENKSLGYLVYLATAR